MQPVRTVAQTFEEACARQQERIATARAARTQETCEQRRARQYGIDPIVAAINYTREQREAAPPERIMRALDTGSDAEVAAAINGEPSAAYADLLAVVEMTANGATEPDRMGEIALAVLNGASISEAVAGPPNHNAAYHERYESAHNDTCPECRPWEAP